MDKKNDFFLKSRVDLIGPTFPPIRDLPIKITGPTGPTGITGPTGVTGPTG
ncbi:exosporium leader peptide, partial [Bacillus thuringiensis]